MQEVVEREMFKPGEIIRHFKRDFCTEEELNANKYLYKVVGIFVHTETHTTMLGYQALYFPFTSFVRPLVDGDTAAMGFVDKDKYPEAKQTFRLEKYDFNKENK